MDHWYRPCDREITLHTLLVYFNDDFEGGETAFQEQLQEVVVPRPGRVVLFQHKLRHEGCPVIRGTKYAMRSDVIYESMSRLRARLELDAADVRNLIACASMSTWTASASTWRRASSS